MWQGAKAQRNSAGDNFAKKDSKDLVSQVAEPTIELNSALEASLTNPLRNF
jgi:hypothetical protein